MVLAEKRGDELSIPGFVTASYLQDASMIMGLSCFSPSSERLDINPEMRTVLETFIRPNLELLPQDDDMVRNGFVYEVALHAACIPDVPEEHCRNFRTRLAIRRPGFKPGQVWFQLYTAAFSRPNYHTPAGVEYMFETRRKKGMNASMELRYANYPRRDVQSRPEDGGSMNPPLTPSNRVMELVME